MHAHQPLLLKSTIPPASLSPLPVPVPKPKLLSGGGGVGVATRIPIPAAAPAVHVRLPPGSSLTSGGGGHHLSLSSSLSLCRELTDASSTSPIADGPATQSAARADCDSNFIDLDSYVRPTANGYELPLTAPTNANRNSHAEMLKEPYVMIRNRYVPSLVSFSDSRVSSVGLKRIQVLYVYSI